MILMHYTTASASIGVNSHSLYNGLRSRLTPEGRRESPLFVRFCPRWAARGTRSVAAACIGSVLLYGSCADAAPRATEFSIAVTGSPGVTFEADCVATARGVDAPFTLKGEVPQRRDVPAEAVRCRIAKRSPRGTLTVEVSKGPAVLSRSSTSGAMGTIVVNVAAP